MIKKLIAAVLVLALIGVGTGIYLFYKPTADAGSADGIPVTAVELAKQYTADEQKANTDYLGKVVQVSGTVSEVSKNQDGAVVVIFETGDPMAPVLCTMEDKAVVATASQSLTLKGFCNGNNLGVVLNRCVVVE